MNLKTAITAKLEERKAAAYLRKCKQATAAALAAIAEEAEETGQDLQAVLALHLGKRPTRAEARRSQSEAERALALLRGAKTTTTSTAKPAATPNSPFGSAPTDHLVALVRRKYLTGPDLDAARRELALRGVEILKSGFSFTSKQTAKQ